MKETIDFEYKNSSEFFQYVIKLLDLFNLSPQEKQQIINFVIILIFENMVDILAKYLNRKDRNELFKLLKLFKDKKINSGQFEEKYQFYFSSIDEKLQDYVRKDILKLLSNIISKLSLATEEFASKEKIMKLFNQH